MWEMIDVAIIPNMGCFPRLIGVEGLAACHIIRNLTELKEIKYPPADAGGDFY